MGLLPDRPLYFWCFINGITDESERYIDENGYISMLIVPSEVYYEIDDDIQDATTQYYYDVVDGIGRST